MNALLQNEGAGALGTAPPYLAALGTAPPYLAALRTALPYQLKGGMSALLQIEEEEEKEEER